MKIHSEQEMIDFGKSFATKAAEAKVIELVGDVGAGKTTFVRGLAEGLGITDPVTSPSFTISKSYALPSNKTLVHYDFYRLPNPGIMRDNLNEVLSDENSIVIIEWSDSIKDILPKDRIKILIKLNNDGSREIEVEDNRNSTFRGILRPTGSKLARSPVTTGATKRAEESAVRLFLDTSTPTTILKLNDQVYEWESGRDLAENLLQFLKDKLAENDADFTDLTEITFMSGPGSFTGLRIGASIVNTLAHELNIPLYDHHGIKQQIIIPDYGRGANISAPRK